MTDHPWQESAAAYALGALDADERAAFEAHLAGCAACRVEVQAFREVAGLLAGAAPAVAAPPGLRDRALGEARRVRPIGRGALLWLPWLAAAASLVLALGAGYAWWSGRAARAALELSLQQTRLALDSNQAIVEALLDSAVGTAGLAATGRPPAIRLFWNRARHVVVMAAFDLPPAPAGRTYQLWAIKKGQTPVSLGTFNTLPGGRLVATMPVPPGFKPDLSAVTEEPAGGSPQPTRQPFLVGSWQGIE